MTPQERIIEQAMQMFVTQGIKSVRMDDISQELGVSKRTLYEFFGDKEGLLYQAMVCYFERNRLSSEALLVQSPPRNVLEAMFRVLSDVMDRADTTGCLMDNLRKFYPAVHEKLVHEGSKKNRDSFRMMLEQGITEGLFVRNINIDLAISVLYYTCTALVSPRGEFVLPDNISKREAFVQIVSNFFRGVSTAEGLRLIDDYLQRYELTRNRA